MRPGRRCCRYVGEIDGWGDLEPQNTYPNPDILNPKNDMKPEGNLESKIVLKRFVNLILKNETLNLNPKELVPW